MLQRLEIALPAGAALLAFLTAATRAASAQQTPAVLMQFLRHGIGFDSTQRFAVERGEVVVKVLDTPNKRDVAVFGIITAAVPRALYVRRLQDFPNSLRTPTRTRFGIFSDPAMAADVQLLTIDAEDVADLKDCRPGDCKIKLPAEEMQRIQRAVDWSAPDLQAQVSAYARQRLLQYVADYRARGDSALVVYDDRGHVRASEAFAALLAESPYIYQYAPSFHRYLATYPHGTLDSLREVLFWSEDALPRLKPILSITHLVVYAPPELSGATLVAAKQIYADHYFEAAFDLQTVVDRPASPAGPAIYLVWLRRFRFDDLPSGVFNIRGKVVGKLRDQLRADLEREKAASERALAR